MRRIVVLATLAVLVACTAFAQGFPKPAWDRVNIEAVSPYPDPDKPHWIDATPIFDDMAKEAAKRFKPVVRRMPKEGVPIGGEETFWAMNIATKQFVQVPAILKRIGQNCYLYVEKGREVDDVDLDAILAQFDSNIYPTDTKTFGGEPKPGVDGDERITLLMLDILDGWEPGKGYVGGYFFPLNEYSVKDFPQSNEREMLYLDLNPANPKEKFYMGVVAHEFQHLIHFNHDPRETKWINEGNSQYAFRACGFGHPSQILTFTRAPDHSLADWKNTIDDYGCVYLFCYYLYQKYPGIAGPLPLLVTDDKAQGIESIDNSLAKAGYKTTFEQIFADWSVANILSDTYSNDGKWGYDETLPVKVWSHSVDPRQAPDTIKDSVQPWATDYYKADGRPFWSPAFPTVADIVSINLQKPGFVIWSVDDGVLPPKELWPPETRELEAGKTALTRCSGTYPLFKVGPFVDKPVKKINFSLFTTDYVSTDHGQITITPKDPQLMPMVGKLSIDFQGKKGGILGPKEGLNVRVMVQACSTKLIDLPLDKDWKASKTIAGFGTEMDCVTLLVGNTAKKPIEYEVKFGLNLQPTMRSSLEAIERGQQLLEIIKPQIENKKDILEPLFLSTTKQLEELTRSAVDLLDPARTPDAAENAKAMAEFGYKPAFEAVLRMVSERRTFASQHAEPWDGKISDAIEPLLQNLPENRETPNNHQASDYHQLSGNREVSENREASEDRVQPADGRETSASTTPAGNDSDTSHSNILYLCNKKQELIHGLTHLKIDPQFVEGQILQMYKLLQLSLNLPNIPLPDGLGIVDYNETSAQSWVDKLRTGGEPDADVKESLKRLTIYEDLTERLYNNNLTMAEDFGTCLYEAVRLVLTGRATLVSIANGLSDVPIVGTLAQKVVKLIIGKAIGVVSRVTNLIAVKLKPPYSTIVPIVVQIGGSVAAKLLHVQVSESQSWMIPWAAKTAAKYAFVSIPKIGYVAKTQSYIEAGVAQAVKNDFGGTTDDAIKAVLDDGNPNTTTALFEGWATGLINKHNFTMKEIEAAKIAKAIAQIAGYASLIDPTNISRVVGILSASVAGGALVHGMANTMIEFSHTKARLDDGLKLAFHPEKPLVPAKSALARVKVPAGKLGSTLRLLGTLKADYNGFAKQAKDAFAAKDTKALTQIANELVAFEETFEPTDRLSAMTCEAALAGTTSESNLDHLVDMAIQSDMARSDVLAALLPAAAGALPEAGFEDRVNTAAQSLEEYLGNLSRVLGKLDNDEIAPRVGINQVKVEAKPDGWLVSAAVTLIAPDPAEVSFTLYGAPDTVIRRSPSAIQMNPWDSVSVEWFVEGATASGFPVTVVADSERLIPGAEVAILP